MPGLISRNPGDGTTTTPSSKDTSSKRVIDLENLSSKGVSFLMENSSALSKSRTQKFHKLFKSVPNHEFPVDYFSCAYIGDILLQGNLYVSQNWFCFYSRIRGRGRLLEIPMADVISITREKTAIIFPNAIGLQTKEEKFAFGSFISRDNTYKFLVSMWRKSQETAAMTNERSRNKTNRISRTSRQESTASSSAVPEELLDGDLDTTPNLNINENTGDVDIVNHTHSKSDLTDQSDESVCLECGSVEPSDINIAGSKEVSDKTDTNSSPTHKAFCKSKGHVHRHTSKEKKMSHVRRKGLEGQRLQFPYSVMHCVNREKNSSGLA